MGLGRGLFNNYGPIYLQEQMEASSAMIGKTILIGSIFYSYPVKLSENKQSKTIAQLCIRYT